MPDAKPPAPPKIRIVYKKKKDRGHGHHGGAWKVAFADFMTAMMALFLVLWIMSQSQEVKQAVAVYFRHPTDYEGKADAILRGNMGLMNHKSGRLDTAPNIIDTPGAGLRQEARPRDSASAESVAGAPGTIAAEAGLRPAQIERLLEQEKDEIRTFLDLADQLWAQLGMDPGFLRVKEQILIETYEDGLVVQLLDRGERGLLEEHSDRLHPTIRKVLDTIAKQLKDLPNKLEVDGHGIGLTNDASQKWLGSAHLADLARRELLAAGLNSRQISKVAGCADSRPLNPADPHDGMNRRISILVRPRQWQPERY